MFNYRRMNTVFRTGVIFAAALLFTPRVLFAYTIDIPFFGELSEKKNVGEEQEYRNMMLSKLDVVSVSIGTSDPSIVMKNTGKNIISKRTDKQPIMDMGYWGDIYFNWTDENGKILLSKAFIITEDVLPGASITIVDYGYIPDGATSLIVSRFSYSSFFTPGDAEILNENAWGFYSVELPDYVFSTVSIDSVTKKGSVLIENTGEGAGLPDVQVVLDWFDINGEHLSSYTSIIEDSIPSGKKVSLPNIEAPGGATRMKAVIDPKVDMIEGKVQNNTFMLDMPSPYLVVESVVVEGKIATAVIKNNGEGGFVPLASCAFCFSQKEAKVEFRYVNPMSSLSAIEKEIVLTKPLAPKETVIISFSMKKIPADATGIVAEVFQQGQFISFDMCFSGDCLVKDTRLPGYFDMPDIALEKVTFNASGMPFFVLKNISKKPLNLPNGMQITWAFFDDAGKVVGANGYTDMQLSASAFPVGQSQSNTLFQVKSIPEGAVSLAIIADTGYWFDTAKGDVNAEQAKMQKNEASIMNNIVIVPVPAPDMRIVGLQVNAALSEAYVTIKNVGNKAFVPCGGMFAFCGSLFQIGYFDKAHEPIKYLQHKVDVVIPPGASVVRTIVFGEPLESIGDLGFINGCMHTGVDSPTVENGLCKEIALAGVIAVKKEVGSTDVIVPLAPNLFDSLKDTLSLLFTFDGEKKQEKQIEQAKKLLRYAAFAEDAGDRSQAYAYKRASLRLVDRAIKDQKEVRVADRFVLPEVTRKEALPFRSQAIRAVADIVRVADDALPERERVFRFGERDVLTDADDRMPSFEPVTDSVPRERVIVDDVIREQDQRWKEDRAVDATSRGESRVGPEDRSVFENGNMNEDDVVRDDRQVDPTEEIREFEEETGEGRDSFSLDNSRDNIMRDNAFSEPAEPIRRAADDRSFYEEQVATLQASLRALDRAYAALPSRVVASIGRDWDAQRLSLSLIFTRLETLIASRSFDAGEFTREQTKALTQIRMLESLLSTATQNPQGR